MKFRSIDFKLIPFTLLLLAISPGLGLIAGETLPPHERIEVEAAPIDRASHLHSGQRYIITPESPSLYDARLHFQQQSSFILEESSRISSTGFVVPRVRGQGLELTEVFLEDLRLFDSYSGLPLLAELDLRAFGAMEITKGLPPASLHSLNPIGAIRYRLLPSHLPGNALGLDYGKPFGQSLWLRKRWSLNSNSFAQVFGRYHASDGRYPYYDHMGTPYNTADDRISIRKQNARESWQIMPLVFGRAGQHSWRILAWHQNVDQEQAGLSSQRPSQARERVDFSLLAASWQIELDKPWAPDNIQFQIRFDKQEREFTDPSRAFLGGATNSQMELEQKSLGLSSEWLSGFAESYHKLEFLTNQIDVAVQNSADLDLNLLRDRKQVYWGGLWPLLSTWHLTHKMQFLQHDDRFPKQESNQHRVLGLQNTRVQNAKAFGMGLRWNPSYSWEIYSQWSRYDRPPSLLEEFGNGGGIAGNPKLEMENLQHYELGGKWQVPAFNLQAYAAVFQDKVQNKIVFIPRFENALIATNIGRSEIHGLEWGARWLPYGGWELTANETRIRAMDLSSSVNTYWIPGIPETVRTASVAWRAEQVFTKLWLRQQGRFYRDQRNGRMVPGSILVDLTGDLALGQWLGLEFDELELSWQILNIFDVKSLSLYSQGGEIEQKGRIPLSSFDGAPQPGRNYKVSVTWSY